MFSATQRNSPAWPSGKKTTPTESLGINVADKRLKLNRIYFQNKIGALTVASLYYKQFPWSQISLYKISGLTSLSVMMLGCCPYLSRISTSSVGSLLALLMICNRDNLCLRWTWKTSRCRLCGCGALPWLRTPCRFLCVGSAYRWSRTRRRCLLWSRRCLRTGMCFCAAAVCKDTNVNTDITANNHWLRD